MLGQREDHPRSNPIAAAPATLAPAPKPAKAATASPAPKSPAAKSPAAKSRAPKSQTRARPAPTPKPATSTRPPIHDYAGCYSHPGRPYPYDDQADNPFCRVTMAGAIERALPASVSYGRGARIVAEPLRPGRHAIVDSFGKPFGYFRQISGGRVRIYNQHGHLYGTSSGRTVAQVQGRGCMVTDRLSNRYMILALFSSDGNAGVGPGGVERDVGARGFVQRTVLPPGVFHRAYRPDSANNNTVIDSFNSGCGASHSAPPGWPPVVRLVKPRYSEIALYQGARRHCLNALARTCGGHYADYSRPGFSPDAVPLTSASTGVRNGGIVRAYARTSKPLRLVDAIGYADPNVPCGQSPAAQWLRVDANPNPARGQHHIYGWYPLPVKGLPPRRC